MTRALFTAACGVLLLTAPTGSLAQMGVSPEKGNLPEAQKIYSPYVERTASDKNFAEGVYWGDTHLHTNMPNNVKMTLQERAYTSPIWYTP